MKFFGLVVLLGSWMPLAMADMESVTDTLIEGSIGLMHYRSELTSPGKILVQFDRPDDSITINVAWNARKIQIQYPAGAAITAEDRELFLQLARTVEEEVGRKTLVADNLVRQASLLGAHPLTTLTIKEISGFQLQSWQTLCTGRVPSSRTFEWDVGSTVTRRVLPYGPNTGDCSARCGAGCYSVGTSAWTQDCGNHDYCEKYSATSDCMDEFASAADDFSFAPNCSY